MEYKFIADNMLGRLAKWLRTLGYDTLYYKNMDDEKLVKIAQEEDRIILTRDSYIKYDKLILIEDDFVKRQLRQVIKTLNIKVDKDKIFTRCLICNEKVENIKKEEVKDKVPTHVYETQEEFVYCKNCDKIYWQGSHFKNTLYVLKEFI